MPRDSYWERLALLCLASVLLFDFLLLASSAAYLGWHDAAYYLAQERVWGRLRLTLWTAALSTGFTMLLGIPTGFALSRLRLPAPHLFDTLVDLPVMVPPAAIGVFLFGVVQSLPVRPVLELFGVRFGHQTAGVLLCQVTVTMAFAIRFSRCAFDAVPRRLEEVSRTLGASWWQTLWRVTLPLAGRGILAGGLVVFARAAAEWEALMLFVGATQGLTDTLPFAVYLDWNGGLMGLVTTMSLLCVAVSVSAMAAVRALRGGSDGAL